MVVINDRIIMEQPNTINNRRKLKFAFIARVFLLSLFHFAPYYHMWNEKTTFSISFKSALAGAFSSILAKMLQNVANPLKVQMGN